MPVLATSLIRRGKDQWGVQAFLYGSFHGLYPDLPRATHFKQKRTQRARFNYQPRIVAVPNSNKTRKYNKYCHEIANI
jgi:hypothetical protein